MLENILTFEVCCSSTWICVLQDVVFLEKVFKGRIFEDGRCDESLVGKIQRVFDWILSLFYLHLFSFCSARLCDIELFVTYRIKYKLCDLMTALLKIYCFSFMFTKFLICSTFPGFALHYTRDTMSLLSYEAPQASLIISLTEQ